MKIVCESCGAKYSIADEKVAGKVFKIRCKKCSAVIVVKGDQPSEGSNASAFDYGGEAVWHVVVAGEQQGPFAPRQIGELLAEGKIDWEAYVWREGMDGWQPAKDVEALVSAVMAEAEGGEQQASSEAAPRGEVFGGSSDMGADPFASSDDGGLSGVIGQAPAATAAGGGADLFADSTRSAFAGAAASDEDDHGGLTSIAGSPKVSGDQAMTGQRNENSVLFSLANLQALATGTGSAPASSTPSKPGMATGEGSGLIDIRALASATQAVSDKPSASSREKIEDLLAVGSTSTTFSATSLAAPVATERGGGNNVLMIGMAAAILLLGGVVTYLAVRPAQQPVALTPAPENTGTGSAEEEDEVENLRVPAAAVRKEAAEAPQAAEPTAAAEQPTQDKDESEGKRGEGPVVRKERRHSTGEPAAKPEPKPEPVAAAEPKKPAQPSSSGDRSLDDLLNTALGGGKKPASKPEPAATENLPPTPSRDDVLSAMKGVTAAVQACGGGESGVAMTKVGVTGPTGKVSGVEVSGQFAGSSVGSCVAKEVRKAKFPRFAQPTFSFSYPFKL